MHGATVMLALGLAACGPEPRFAFRPPVLRDDDMRPFQPRPASRPVLRVSDGIDGFALRPVTEFLRFRPHESAVDVNALDEVPDSSWFTNRVPTPNEIADGACRGVAPPALPLFVEHVKNDGTTPGLVTHDALGRRFLVKVDIYPEDRPETSTAADAIVSRLYWAAGFNTPCNRVVYVRSSDFVLAPAATRAGQTAAEDSLRSVLARAVQGPDGTFRLGTSLLVDGEPLGPWPSEGTRSDDPNDRIPHEDRRELRAERWLAAWVNHWDAREINTLDSFVRTRANEGYVAHWFIDFGDAIGGRTSQMERAPTLGFASMLSVHVGRASRREARIDPEAPNLGYFGFERFDPNGWTPLIPSTRFERADADDEAWMARRIAAITPEHLEAAISAGRFSHPAVSRRLLTVLVERRTRILRDAFARRSPLSDVEVGNGMLCATDLALRAGIVDPGAIRFDASFAHGNSALLPARLIRAGDRVCVSLPPHFAPDAAPRDDARRYVMMEIARRDGSAITRLRAYGYDLGREGFVLAGIEH